MALVGGWLTASSLAATDARLQGVFEIIGQSEGKTVRRDFAFSPLCATGPCRKVALRREGPRGKHFRSTLKRTGTGRYKGKEPRQRIGRCKDGGKLLQSAKHRVKITRARNGRATAIRGRVRFKLSGCDRDAFTARYFGIR